MTRRAYQLITDLLSDDYQMLYKGNLKPYGISIFHHPESNPEVKEAVQRIQKNVLTWLDPDNVYLEERKYQAFPDGSSMVHTPSTLILILLYPGSIKRIFDIVLTANSARLHFRK